MKTGLFKKTLFLLCPTLPISIFFLVCSVCFAQFCIATDFLDTKDALLSKRSKTYTFQVAKKTPVRVSFQHAKYSHTIPWTFELRNKDKHRLLRVKSPGDIPVITKTIVLDAGVYVVKISASHPAVKKSEYQITVQAVTQSGHSEPVSFPGKTQLPDIQIEKGNPQHSASKSEKLNKTLPVLSADTHVTDNVGSSRKKVYLLNITESGLQQINFNHPKQNHNLPWALTLKNEKGQSLLRAKSIGKDNGITRYIALAKGNYSLTVTCSNNKLLNTEYEIAVRRVPEKIVELEYNNTNETATPAALNTLYSGILQTVPQQKDTDFYTFDILQEGNVVIQFLHEKIPSDIAWKYALYSTEKRLFSNQSIGKQTKTTEAIMLPAGKYYLKIWATTNELNGFEYKVGAFYEEKEVYLYRLAEEANTISRFRKYLTAYPDGKFKKDALLKIEDLRFQHAEEEFSISSYTQYMTAYPKGRYFGKAEESRAYLEAKGKNIADVYERFLHKYPQSKFKKNTLQLLENLRYAEASRIDTVDSYSAFLQQWPTGLFCDEARSKKDSLLYKKAMAEYKVSSFEEYLKEFPQGKFHKEIKQEKKHLLYFKEVSAAKSISAYDAYLQKYPQGRYLQIIKNQREELLWAQSKANAAIADFDNYLKEYPSGKFATTAKKLREELFWKQSRGKSTIAGFDKYLQEYPSGRFAAAAKKLREELFWKQSRSKSTIAGFDEYLQEYPLGRFTAVAKQLREKLFWQQSEGKATVAGFDDYLQEYPDGMFVIQARKEREQLLWHIARKRNTVVDFEKYLHEYPAGEFAVQAKQKKEILLWTEAKKSNSIDDLDHYLREYPQGKYFSAAIKRREKLFWQEAGEANTVAAYDRYLKEFPTGKHIKKGQERREILFWKKIDENKTVDGYLDYLQQYPTGKYVTKAKKDLETPLYRQASGSGNIALYNRYLSHYPDGKYIQEISMELIYHKYENLFTNESNSQEQYSLSEFEQMIDRAGQDTKAEFVKRSKDNLSIFNCSATCVTQVIRERKGTAVGNVAAFDKDQAARLYREWNPCGRITYFQLINRASTMSAISQCRQGKGEYNVEMDEEYSSQGRYSKGQSHKTFMDSVTFRMNCVDRFCPISKQCEDFCGLAAASWEDDDERRALDYLCEVVAPGDVYGCNRERSLQGIIDQYHLTRP